MPATSMIRAHESTLNVPAGRNKVEIEQGIHWLDPDAAPLTGVITKAATRKKEVHNPQFKWNEKGNAPKADTVNGAIADGNDTTIVVDNGDYFGVYDLVKVPSTGEIFRVTAVDTSTDTLTVTRGVGATAAAAIADDATLRIVGNAWAEGAPKGTPRSHVEATPYNYTEIFRHQFGETRTQRNTDTYISDSGNSRTDLRAEKGREHKLDIEYAFLFGDRFEISADTNAPVRGTGGLLYWLTANTLNAGGGLSSAEMATFIQSLFQYSAGGSTRLLLASPTVMTVLDQIAMANIQTVSDRNINYGISLKQWHTSHGDLLVARHPLLTGDYAGYAFAVDPAKLKYAYLQNSDTMLNEDIQDNGDDRWTDEYLSEVGLQLSNPELSGLLYGVTSAA